ncbi:MAG: histone deacetylase [Spirochaetaceae bacterium]|jgi:acetoin utilization deacetylase AcuC-like enzyme|nr:histone deacetylase [Spirochaetaceae bacterium]
MILNDPVKNSNWHDYGILIPFPPERPGRILQYLAGSAPVFECAPVSPRTQYESLLLIHEKEYLDLLFGALGEDAAAHALLQIYELIGADGKPRRYNAARAVKPLSALFREFTLTRLEGTYNAAILALKNGFCYYLAGGNHHARYEFGAGFCVLNDLVYAARRVQAEGRAKLIWLIDVDAHKGCGSAEIVSLIRGGAGGWCFEAGCDILTLSAHMAHGWPLDAETLSSAKPGRAPLVASDVELPVEAGEEALYNEKLRSGLERLRELSGGRRCDLAIVVDGSDPYELDGLESSSKLNLTLRQCVERDMLIYNFLREMGIPSAWTMAGGYGEHAWEPPAHFLSELMKPR